MNYYDGPSRWLRNCGVCKEEYYISHDEEEERCDRLMSLGGHICDRCDKHYDELIEELKQKKDQEVTGG